MHIITNMNTTNMCVCPFVYIAVDLIVQNLTVAVEVLAP